MYRFQVNGTQHEVQEDQRLIDFLRADLKLTGTKEGCSAGACGTCTVIIDGKKAKACVTKLSQLDGKSVVTIEGLSEREKAVYTYAFGECGAVQCGFCIPGMIISAKVLIDENNDPDKISLKVVPKHTLVYEIIGPMFFAAADKFLEISAEPGIKVVIIRMRGVPAMDVTALRSLTNIHEICKKKGITLVLSHVQEQPRAMMEKAGFVELVGEENFCANIDAALAHAAEIDR